VVLVLWRCCGGAVRCFGGAVVVLVMRLDEIILIGWDWRTGGRVASAEGAVTTQWLVATHSPQRCYAPCIAPTA
jgi:hypothetical protein